MTALPFLMAGVSMDGVFVLKTALDGTDGTLPLNKRIGHVAKKGGVSITVASLTNVGAFLIGANTGLPALRAFSVFAAIGLLFNLLLQVRFCSSLAS